MLSRLIDPNDPDMAVALDTEHSLNPIGPDSVDSPVDEPGVLFRPSSPSDVDMDMDMDSDTEES